MVDRLRAEGLRKIVVLHTRDYDLVDQAAVERAYCDGQPDMVIHRAAEVGGIGVNQKRPGEFF